MENNEEHLLFTDGSSLGNPGPGGWGAILVLNNDRVIELGGREEHTTNNRMELISLVEGLRRLHNESGNLTIYTDSSYAVKGATEWSLGWKRRDWKTMAKTDVENRDIWEPLLLLIEERKKIGQITWEHIPGHSGIEGNERADEIATGFAGGSDVELYEGDLGDYALDILNIAMDERRARKRAVSRTRSRQTAYSYLSLVDGVAKRHVTWAECEKRVKGKAGVKYKKAVSPEDEKEILHSWGIRAIK